MSGFSQNLTDEAETIKFGKELSLFATTDITICLSGDLGSGKSTLARAFIRHLADNDELEVPSPTFPLVQPYENLRVPVHHYDLYRINDPAEVFELGFFENLEKRLTIVEWPDCLGDEIPPDRIEIELNEEKLGRSLSMTGYGTGKAIVCRFKQVVDFLRDGEWQNANRTFFQGDASARRYEKLIQACGTTAILMDMPASPDGPIVKDGKPYSQIAHIAQSILPVIAINKGLLDHGLSAPKSLQENIDTGLMIIEYFGDAVFSEIIKQPEDIKPPLLAATQLLAHFTTVDWPKSIAISNKEKYEIPGFDQQTFLIEAELLVDWFIPMVTGSMAYAATKRSFVDAWRSVFSLLETGNNVWVMRDFHTPNLMWLPERELHRRVGLIDTQDCVLGHPAYDLVSLLQDARVDLPADSEKVLLQHYLQLRQGYDANFDPTKFKTAYAILGAQRATKILGIFARLFVRDKKPAYLKHLPRVSNALEKNLSHQSLQPVALWFKEHLPPEKRYFESEL